MLPSTRLNTIFIPYYRYCRELYEALEKVENFARRNNSRTKIRQSKMKVVEEWISNNVVCLVLVSSFLSSLLSRKTATKTVFSVYTLDTNNSTVVPISACINLYLL